MNYLGVILIRSVFITVLVFNKELRASLSTRYQNIHGASTVKVMIMSRYRYRFRANVTQRYATLHQRYRPLQTVTDRYRPLPNFTVTCVTSVTDPKWAF